MRKNRLCTLLAVAILAGAAGCGRNYYDAVITKRIAQLEDKEASTRVNAAWSLGQMGERAASAVPALIEALKDSDPEVRATAAGALYEMGPKAEMAVPRLIETMADEEADVRLAAATTLGWIGAPAASPAVPALTLALHDRDIDVRAMAAWALGEMGPDAVSAYDDLAKGMEDSAPEVRESSAKALLKVKGDDGGSGAKP